VVDRVFGYSAIRYLRGGTAKMHVLILRWLMIALLMLPVSNSGVFCRSVRRR
jgi:hypothetical protein